MAELVDAPGLGPGVFRDVQVQVLSPALFDVARHSSSMSRHFFWHLGDEWPVSGVPDRCLFSGRVQVWSLVSWVEFDSPTRVVDLSVVVSAE